MVMLARRQAFLGCSLAFAWSLVAACSGVDPNAKIQGPPVPDAGASADGTVSGEAGGSSSSSSGGGVGGVCGNVSCTVPDDCMAQCGPPPQVFDGWCCNGGLGGCYQWRGACPVSGSPPLKDAGGP